MKGYTKIELTNVHTGEKEVVEKHNIITNNLSEMYKTYLMCNFQSYYFNSTDPLYDKGMGGIILFSNQLTEDANKYGMILNSADDIVGCAGNFVNTTDDRQLGSRNQTESKILDNGYKYVWDFGTSQANGTISAVGLTSHISCNRSGQAYATPYPVTNLSYSPSTSTFSTFGLESYTFSNIVSYDFDNNTFVAVNLVSATEIKFSIYKIDMGIQHILAQPNGSKKVLKLSETTVNIPVELNMQYGNILDGFDGYYYYVEHPNYSKLKLARISKTNFTYDSTYGLKDITYDSNNFMYLQSSDDTSIYDRIANGYLYTRSAYKYGKLHKINLTDPTKYTDIQLSVYPNNPGGSGSAMASNGKCIYTCGDIIFPDDSVVHYSYANTTSPGSYIVEYGFACDKSAAPYTFNILISQDSTKYIGIPVHASAGYTQVGLGYFFNSLSTINNLSSSVVKTADKTMKITYTLTEGE